MARKYDHEYKVQAVKLAKEIGGARACLKIINTPRACLKNVNMSNQRVFCPLDGAIFP